ncbi:MAG: L-2-amino-thiazoline-4-carboxylic acid hydrolase [Candidatus Thorarchaeota archaeon]
MAKPKTHKFDEKVDISFIQYIKNSLSGEVELQRELERVLGEDEAHRILKEWATKKTSEAIREILENSGIKIQNLRDFKKYMDEMWLSERISKTHTCETFDSKSDDVTYKVTECIWAKAMRELDAADLGLLTMCDIDFVSASIYNPNLKLIREKTLMNGDDYCDFTYVWKNE